MVSIYMLVVFIHRLCIERLIPCRPKRIVTIPRSSDGYGFKLTGGNAVGLFVSDVAAGRDEIKVGDQVRPQTKT